MTDGVSDFDVVVIGGGINGAGIARDAALRGLRVLLLEKGDFGSGTSSWSSRLIHGGLRYLEYGELHLVYESLRERRLLQRNAPHLVRRLPLTIPVYEDSNRGLGLIRIGMLAYDLLSIGKSVPRHRILGRSKLIATVPGISTDGLRGGARYFDAQVTFAERLVLENVIAAAEAGATVRNYCPVIGLHVSHNQLQSLHYKDGDNEHAVTATVVVNAAGPWVDRVLATVNRDMPDCMGGTKGSHIVVPAFAQPLRDAIYAEAKADGRPFFIIPWNDQVLIGTTDMRYDGDPGEASASAEEIDYLLDETRRLFPHEPLDRDSIHFAYAGVRPLPRQESGPESAITRRHIIKKHRLLARGLVSVIGGKLTTYRSLAEQVVNYVNRKTGSQAGPCRTRREPLPGAVGIDDARHALESVTTLSPTGRRRLLGIYGGRALQIAQRALADAELARTIAPGQEIISAEIAHVFEREMAATLTDAMHRRTMLGLSPDLGRACANDIAAVAARLQHWSDGERKRQLADLETYNARLTTIGQIADNPDKTS
jgi:glycerol-3-phosphate dehydrogenase